MEKRWNSLGVYPNSPMRHFWYAVSLALFALFVVMDYVAIVNSLDVSSFSVHVPAWAQEIVAQYELAVAIGTIITLVVVAVVAEDLWAKKGFTDWNEATGVMWWVGTATVILLGILGFAVVIGLGLNRLLVMIKFTPAGELFVNNYFAVMTALVVPLNTVIVTLLIHNEALKGIVVLALCVEQFVHWILYLIYYALKVFGNCGTFLGEAVMYLGYGIVTVLFFLMLTPFFMLAGLISRISNRGTGGSTTQTAQP